MAYLLGIVLFAFAIFFSVCLHEAGHMAAAKAFGMKVTRYFAGFGPTVWSFRRGETEYGLKAIPLGGFVKIVGMTPQDDDVEPGDEHRAMWRFPVWKRTVVMVAGIAANIAIGFIFLWVVFAFVGAATPARSIVTVQPCVVPTAQDRACKPGIDPAGPAAGAQLQDGDRITAIGDRKVSTYEDLVTVIRSTPPGTVDVTYVRDGRTSTVPIKLAEVQRPPIDDLDSDRTVRTSALGIGPAEVVGPSVTYGPVDSVGKAARAGGNMFTATFASFKALPAGVASLWDSLSGGERSLNTPVSVVGITDLGAQSVAEGAWDRFWALFISLNFFLGIFNLVPLLPLDGGHVAIAWFERIRSWVYARLHRPDPGRVDYARLMPLTLAVVALLGGLVVLTVAADVVNPIRLP